MAGFGLLRSGRRKAVCLGGRWPAFDSRNNCCPRGESADRPRPPAWLTMPADGTKAPKVDVRAGRLRWQGWLIPTLSAPFWIGTGPVDKGYALAVEVGCGRVAQDRASAPRETTTAKSSISLSSPPSALARRGGVDNQAADRMRADYIPSMDGIRRRERFAFERGAIRALLAPWDC